MTNREKMMQILDKPVFPEGKDPLEAVADYLLENDVVPVVRCKDCKYCECMIWDSRVGGEYTCNYFRTQFVNLNHFCSYGERRGENATD